MIDAMASSGRYFSQFLTGTSNGGVTAHPGGDRWRWENRLFHGRYDRMSADRRPVYGAVDLGDRHGPAPRFGSAFLRLTSEASERATYCYPDSAFHPDLVVSGDDVPSLVTRMLEDDLDPLDRYVEAHVHGGVALASDVEAIVLDPCYRGTPTHPTALQLSDVELHPGFSVESGGLDPAYRGAEHATLAASLAEALTPDIIGAAARSRSYDPQALKRVWHLLARFGRQGGPTGKSNR